MQLYVADQNEIQASFALLLEKLKPDLFPEGIILRSAFDRTLIDFYSQLGALFRQFPLDATIEFHFGYDEEGVETIASIELENNHLSSRHKSLARKTHFSSLFEKIAKKSVPESPFTKEQQYYLILLYIIVEHLLAELSFHEKEGKDIAKSLYLIDLLREVLPTLEYKQAWRFFYWGLLKFNCSKDFEHWADLGRFKAYIAKFRD